MGDFVLFGVSVATIVKRLVNLLKLLGVQGKWCLVAALVCGGALFAVRELMLMYPAYEQWFNLSVGVIVTALWASELYDLGEAATQRAQAMRAGQPRADCGCDCYRGD